MTFAKFVTTLVASSFIATSAFAAETGNEMDVAVPGNKGYTIHSQVGAWRVLVDNERKTCMVEKFDEDGNAIQIGLGPKGKNAYLGVFTKLPEDMRGQGDKQVVTVNVNGETYSGRIKRAQRNTYSEYSGVYIPAKNMDLAALSSDGVQTMEFPGGTLSVNFTMDGAPAAVEAAKACHAELNG